MRKKKRKFYPRSLLWFFIPSVNLFAKPNIDHCRCFTWCRRRRGVFSFRTTFFASITVREHISAQKRCRLPGCNSDLYSRLLIPLFRRICFHQLLRPLLYMFLLFNLFFNYWARPNNWAGLWTCPAQIGWLWTRGSFPAIFSWPTNQNQLQHLILHRSLHKFVKQIQGIDKIQSENWEGIIKDYKSKR